MKANRHNKILHAALTALLSVTAAQNAQAAATPIADTPLYLGVSVDPNVFFMIDDSGSMDWEILTKKYWYFASYWNDSTDWDEDGETSSDYITHGRWETYANTGSCPYRKDFEYIFDNDDVLYSGCGNGAIVEKTPRSVAYDWRVRSSDLNVLYYDPSVTYKPWPGYSNASFTSVRSNPQSGQPGYDDLKNLTGFAYESWTDSHGYSGKYPAGPDSATNTPNGEIDLWDNHVRYTIGSSSITRESFTYDPVTAATGTECTTSNLSDSPPLKGCFKTSLDSETVPTDAQGRSIAEIKQNIANWYQYHRKRSFVTKAAVAEVITNKPTFRYGLALINGTFLTEMPASGVTEYETHNTSLINSFLAHRWASNGTPLPWGLEYAGRYYDGDVSGKTSPILPENKGGACQKNFTMLFTDGYWGGSPYPARVTSDKDGDGYSVTVADVAKHYYDKDLSGLADLVVADEFDSATHQHMVTFTVAFGVEGKLVDSDGDGWPNPKLTESSDWGNATGCSDCPEKIDDLWHAAYNSRGTFVAASTPEQVASSLEAALASVEKRTEVSASSVALNSGSISSDALLYQARFNSEDWTGELLAYKIISDTGSASYGQLDLTGSGPDGSQWDAGALLESQDWNSGRTILTYKPSNAKGIAFRWPSDPDSPATTELDTAQVTALNADPATGSSDSEGEARLRFLRGDRSCEVGGSGSCGFDLDNDGVVESSADKLYRQRARVLGDTINSAPTLVGAPNFPYPDIWSSGAPENGAPYSSFKSTYSSRTPVVYIGANDGMLHGFQASGSGAGSELLAYVPSSVYRNLGALTQTDYSHRFYVDGSPTAGDVFYSGAWHSIVAGGLRKGGQGVYALDVTNPATFGETSTAADATVLWEFTDADDADLGYTFSQPALVRMQNGKWAAIFGNGYNNTEADGNASADGRAKLFIVFIEDGLDGSWSTGDYIKIDTGVGTTTTPNGLATVAPVDADGDYVVDYIYAGDLQGNMWKFDVDSANTAQWKLDYKLYAACSGTPCTQSITTRPEVGSAPNGKDLMVYFGTGKYLGSSDPSDTNQQTFYGIIDRGSAITGRSTLLEQTIDVQLEHTFDDGSTYDLRLTSDNALETTQDGWYMDLVDPAGAEPGERVVSHPLLRSGRIIFTTIIPNSNPCSAGGSSWLMEVDARDGSRLGYSPFDLNNDRFFTVKDQVLVPSDVDGDGTIGDDEGYWLPPTGKRSPDLIAGPGVLVGDGEEVKYTPGTSGGVEVTRENPGPAGLKRQSWRQVR